MKHFRCAAMFAALLCVVAVPGAALADAPPWTFVEAGYNDVDLDNLDDDGNGWFAGGSFGILDNWHVFARYSDSNTDDLDFDVTRTTIGGGWHGLLGEKADLLGEIAYVDAEIGPVDDSGYFGRIGVRFRPINLIELGANLRYEDLGDLDDDVVLEANAIIYFWRLGAGLSYESADEVDTYGLFLRLNFSRD